MKRTIGILAGGALTCLVAHCNPSTECSVNGGTQASGAPNPANSCETCQPNVSTSAWTNATDGTACGAGAICLTGACVSGCKIGGVDYATNTINPSNPCQSCQPSISASSWSGLADGTDCGNGQVCALAVCGSQCNIDGKVQPSGTANPSNVCQSCQPGTSTNAWSNVVDGTTCPGGVCSAGGCASACYIGSTLFASAEENPSNPCQSCQPAVSTSVWSTLADGASCGNGQVCASGKCGTQCDIDATIVATGTANPNNACQSCQPGTTTTAWSSVVNGSSCGSGDVCNDGGCASGCYFGGTFYAAGEINSTNGCQSCQPSKSTSGWSGLGDGTSCGNGQICANGNCGSQCDIGGTIYSSGASNPSNSCQSCQPGASTSAWSNAAEGKACGAGVCNGGGCVSGCYIGGMLYTSGQTNTANVCQTCQPTSSTSAWTGVDTPCNNVCVNEQSDTSNCGGCGVTCSVNETCQAGGCTCPIVGSACGLDGTQGAFTCGSGAYGTSCLCTGPSASCEETFFETCDGGITGSSNDMDSDACPSGYTASCSCNTVGGGDCSTSVNSNQSCHMHYGCSATNTDEAELIVMCSYAGP